MKTEIGGRDLQRQLVSLKTSMCLSEQKIRAVHRQGLPGVRVGGSKPTQALQMVTAHLEVPCNLRLSAAQKSSLG